MPNSVSDQPPTLCPNDETLRRFVEDRLSDAETAAIEKHLETCAHCEDTIDQLEKDGVGGLSRFDSARHGSTQGADSHGSLVKILTDPSRVRDLPAPDIPLPKQIDKYEVLEVLGSGGMGTVLRAKHVHLKREVAIKLVKGVRRFDSRAVSRFMQEIEAIGKLDHANIVRAHDAGVDDKIGQPYLVMELLQGRDVEALVRRRGPLSPTDACKLIRQAATGLDQIHRAGLVHRDIKPSNLFVTKDGVVKLLDLGLARLYDEDKPDVSNDASTAGASDLETQDGGLTGHLTVLGSPRFIAPEQIEQSHKVDHRADIYSLGCTFYYLLTAKPPYSGTKVEVLTAHLEGRFPSVSEQRNDISPALDDLIRRMTSRNPNERIVSAKEIIAALDRLKNDSKPQPPAPPVIVAKRKRPTKSYVVGVVSAALLLLILTGLFRMFPKTDAPPEQETSEFVSAAVIASEPSPPVPHTVKEELPERLGPEILKITNFKNGYVPGNAATDSDWNIWYWDGNDKSDIRNMNDVLVIVPDINGDERWPELNFLAHSVEADKRYRFTIEMRSDADASFEYNIIQTNFPFKPLSSAKHQSVGHQWQTYTFYLTPFRSEKNAKIVLNSFEKRRKYEFRSASLREILPPHESAE